MQIKTHEELDNIIFFKVMSILQEMGIYFSLIGNTTADTTKVSKSIKNLTTGAKAEVTNQLAELGLKPCWQCGSILDFDGFNKSKSQKDQLASECKECSKKRSENYRAEQKEIKSHSFSDQEYTKMLWLISNLNESIFELNDMLNNRGEN